MAKHVCDWCASTDPLEERHKTNSPNEHVLQLVKTNVKPGYLDTDLVDFDLGTELVRVDRGRRSFIFHASQKEFIARARDLAKPISNKVCGQMSGCLTPFEHECSQSVQSQTGLVINVIWSINSQIAFSEVILVNELDEKAFGARVEAFDKLWSECGITVEIPGRTSTDGRRFLNTKDGRIIIVEQPSVLEVHGVCVKDMDSGILEPDSEGCPYFHYVPSINVQSWKKVNALLV